ncbi:MAG: hypothetical protein U1E70_24460 [Acetobacteraceae bacterium]
MKLVALIVIVVCSASVGLERTACGQTTDHAPEDQSIAFIHRYMQQWSSPNSEALAYMETVFPDRIVYFNEIVGHAALMQRKRRFAERWPLRSFVLRVDDISVSCDQQRLCTVWGLIDWHCHSPERHADAIGTSVFAFQIRDGRTVLDEGGFVIARGRIVSHGRGAVPAVPQAYSNGDIPELRRTFFDQSADPNWIDRWLQARRPFSGTAQSLGQAGARSLTESDGSARSYAVFQSRQGPIACITAERRALPPSGEAVHLQGHVALFIGSTMYLSNCMVG